MIPAEPGPDQRRRDARLAWILVGCGAAVTLALLIGGILALRAPLARWAATAGSAGNGQAPATISDEITKSDADADQRNSEAVDGDADDLPAASGEVRKQENGRNEDQEGEAPAPPVRRGSTI